MLEVVVAIFLTLLSITAMLAVWVTVRRWWTSPRPKKRSDEPPRPMSEGM
jgi:hypothetical protein